MKLRVTFAILLLSLFALQLFADEQMRSPVRIEIGQSVAALNGPWKFHTGDDSRWADPNFDDSSWETIDLTPPPGAHDSDVGLSGYVPGWAARGHRGYWGYAWYRMRVRVDAPAGDTLALAGPAAVDSAYQIFFSGILLGGSGKFTGSTPTVYSIQSKMFLLPQLHGVVSNSGGDLDVIAFRVWMGPWAIGPDGGGIHIAPALGETSCIRARYQLQWLETVKGYVVEIVEALLFLMLAAMACSLISFDRGNPAYLWLAAGLTLLAMVRANQAVLFWGQFETIHGFEVVTVVLLAPLALGAWTMAWHKWFAARELSWMPTVIYGLTALYMCSQFFGRSWFYGVFPHWFGVTLHFVSVYSRLLFVLLMLLVIYRGVLQRERDKWLAVLCVILISIGLFAQELSNLHIQGIWFPYGTGVSRTQFAYAAFDLAMFVLLLRRLAFFGERYRQQTR
jgi:hypothetical protein